MVRTFASLYMLQSSHAGSRAAEVRFEEQEEEEEADFTTHSDTNMGILIIRESHDCLFCAETKSDTIVRYNAITFSKFIPSEDTLLFRIQTMCDSREWNEVSMNRVESRDRIERDVARMYVQDCILSTHVSCTALWLMLPTEADKDTAASSKVENNQRPMVTS